MKVQRLPLSPAHPTDDYYTISRPVEKLDYDGNAVMVAETSVAYLPDLERERNDLISRLAEIDGLLSAIGGEQAIEKAKEQASKGL